MSRSTVEEIEPGAGHPRRGQILAVMCLSLVLVVVSVSSLNIALPSIIADLHPTSTETLWIIDSYALVFAGLLLPAGALGDRFGRRKALLIGLTIFLLFAVAASFSSGPLGLIAARGVMGVGAALVMPATLSIITVVFPPEERAKAIAIWTGLAAAGGAIGIVSAGLLLEWFEWTSVFWVNVPIAALAIGLIVAIVPESTEAEHKPLDPIGALLSVSGLAILLFAIIEGPERGWSSGLVVVAFVLAVALLVGFVAFELRARYPMLDPRVFLVRRFGLSSLTITANFMVMFGFFLLIAQYFQFAWGTSALESGLRTLPFPAAMIVLSPQSPRLTARIGTRYAITGGLALQGVGFALLATTGVDTSYAVVVAAMVLLAMGMAALMAPATTAIVSSLPLDKAGVASAVNDTTREVGGAIGIAVMGTLLTTGYRSSVEPATEALPAEVAEVASDSVGGALQLASQLDPQTAGELVQAAREGFADGQTLAYGFATVVSLIAAVVVAAFYPPDAGHAWGEEAEDTSAGSPTRGA